MPEDFEEYWRVTRPRRHPAREESKPETTTSPNNPLGEALGTLQRYSQRLNETSSERGDAYARGQRQGFILDATPSDDLERQVQETTQEMLRRGIRLEPGIADRMRADLGPEIAPAEQSPRPQDNSATQSSWTQQLVSNSDFRAVLQALEDPDEAQRTTYAELEVQFQARLESMRAQGFSIDLNLRELRSEFLSDFLDSTRSEPVGDPGLFSEGVLIDAQHAVMEYERMTSEVNANIDWYFFQGVSVSRSELERVYRENGGLRMDFTPERAEEESLQRNQQLNNLRANADAAIDEVLSFREIQPVEQTQENRIQLPTHNGRVSDELLREFTLIAQDNPRLVPETQETSGGNNIEREPINYGRLGRQSEILLNITNLFNELGVSCTVLNQGTSDIELQFSLFRDTPGDPTRIGGYLSSDGVVHLNLGFPRW